MTKASGGHPASKAGLRVLRLHRGTATPVRVALALGVLGLCAHVVTGYALGASPKTSELVSGEPAGLTTTCDANSGSWTYSLTYTGTGANTAVSSVVIGSISTGCSGGLLSLQLTDSTGGTAIPGGSGSAVVGSCSTTCSATVSSLSATATSVGKINVGVVGP